MANWTLYGENFAFQTYKWENEGIGQFSGEFEDIFEIIWVSRGFLKVYRFLEVYLLCREANKRVTVSHSLISAVFTSARFMGLRAAAPVESRLLDLFPLKVASSVSSYSSCRDFTGVGAEHTSHVVSTCSRP